MAHQHNAILGSKKALIPAIPRFAIPFQPGFSGDKYIRTLLVHGGRAVVRSAALGSMPEGRHSKWLVELATRRGANRACVGLANKTARIAPVFICP